MAAGQASEELLSWAIPVTATVATGRQRSGWAVRGAGQPSGESGCPAPSAGVRAAALHLSSPQLFCLAVPRARDCRQR